MTGSALPTLWLSCHVDYACRHSGACCRAGWPLPVDERSAVGIAAAVATARIETVDGRRAWLDESAEAPSGIAGTFRLVDQACVFHVARPSGARLTRETGIRHCAIHATLGHDALPPSCQHFPRVCLVDDRGVRVTLSHFCPTAASMLVDDDRPVAVVTGPPAVPGLAVPEGLDVRTQLPPRLTDRTLTDWEGLSRWEAHVVAHLAGPDAGAEVPECALRELAVQAGRLAGWRPGALTLAEAVAAFETADRDPRRPWPSRPGADVERRIRTFDVARRACRQPWTWPAAPADLATSDAAWVAPAWPAWAPVVRRYLAAKAFASWMTYRLDAATGFVSWLGVALDALRVECARAAGEAGRPLDRTLLLDAIRRADLLLVHYADDAAIARAIAARV